MGLKDWLARVSGPKGYGTAMGRPTREGGSALANSVFMSHGTAKETGPAVIFDTEDDMEAAGFTPRFGAITKIDFSSLTLDEQLLFENLQAAMISFAYILTSNGARQYMRQETYSRFNKGLVPSLSESMVQCGLLSSVEAGQAALSPYLAASDAARQPMVLNMERPASADALENLIVTPVKLCGAQPRYGFARAGPNGFEVIAVPLVEETLKSILAATRRYNW